MPATRRQSTSLGTTLAQSPTPLPDPQRVRVGPVMPTRLQNPPSIVSAMRPPVTTQGVTIPDGGVGTGVISPADAAVIKAAGDAQNALFNSSPILQALLATHPLFQNPTETPTEAGSRLSPADQAQMALNPSADMASVFANNTGALNDAYNAPTGPVGSGPPPQAGDTYSEPQPNPVEAAVREAAQAALGSASPEAAQMGQVDPNSRAAITQPTLLEGLTPPTRNTAAEDHTRNNAVALSTALPLLAALFGGDVSGAMRNTPMNIAQAIAGAGTGADADWNKTLQSYDLGTRANQNENQRRQTDFENQFQLSQQASRDAERASLANARSINADVALNRESRLSNGAKIRQSNFEQTNFQKGAVELARLATDADRATAIADPLWRQAYGLEDMDPVEAAALATVARPIPQGVSGDQRILLAKLNTQFRAWLDPTVPQDRKAEIYNSMNDTLTQLGVGGTDMSGKPIVPLQMSPKDRETLDQRKADADRNYLLARQRTDDEHNRAQAYIAHLNAANALAGTKKTDALQAEYLKIQKELDAAHLKNRKDNIQRLIDESTFPTMSQESRNQAKAVNEAHQAYIDFLFDRKEEIGKQLGVLGVFTPPPTPGNNSAITAPPTIPIPSGRPSPNASAGQASRATSTRRAVSTPTKPTGAVAASGKPTAVVQPAKDWRGVPFVYKPRAAGGGTTTTGGKPTSRPTAKPTPQHSTDSGVTPGGRSYTLIP